MSCKVLALDNYIRQCPKVQHVLNRSIHSSQVPRTKTDSPQISNKTNGESVNEIQDFVSSLSPEKKQELLLEVQKMESLDARKKAEGI